MVLKPDFTVSQVDTKLSYCLAVLLALKPNFGMRCSRETLSREPGVEATLVVVMPPAVSVFQVGTNTSHSLAVLLVRKPNVSNRIEGLRGIGRGESTYVFT